MSKITKKPKWGKPKLIVLTRGKPEERVLYGCKGETSQGDPSMGYGSCESYGGCGPCDSQPES